MATRQTAWTSRRPLRIAVVASKPEKYYEPLWQRLHRLPGVDLTVIYTTGVSEFRQDDPPNSPHGQDGTPGLGNGYQSFYLPGYERIHATDGIISSLNLRIVPHLLRARYDIVWIHAYYVGTNLLAALLQHFVLRRPLFVRDDPHLRNPRSAWKRLVKRLALPLIFSDCIGLYVGSLNREWLVAHGFKDENLFYVPHAVDNERLQALHQAVTQTSPNLRSSFEISQEDGPIVLYAGRLVWEKDLETLIAAFRRVRAQQRCVLLIAGDGPERARIESHVGEAGLVDVKFAGGFDQDSIGKIFSVADVFVLPSQSETWGLVVNEAMNFGLPVVVSDRVGCGPDLVQHGRNGYVFPSKDVSQLAMLLTQLLASSQLREAFGLASLKIIDSHSHDTAIRGVLGALRKCYMDQAGIA